MAFSLSNSSRSCVTSSRNFSSLMRSESRASTCSAPSIIGITSRAGVCNGSGVATDVRDGTVGENMVSGGVDGAVAETHTLVGDCVDSRLPLGPRPRRALWRQTRTRSVREAPLLSTTTRCAALTLDMRLLDISVPVCVAQRLGVDWVIPGCPTSNAGSGDDTGRFATAAWCFVSNRLGRPGPGRTL